MAPAAPSAAPKPAAAKRPAAAPVVRPDSGLDQLDEKTAITRFNRLRNVTHIQTWIIVTLALLLIVAVPLTQPIYMYYAMTPDYRVKQMVGLSMPNMTNRAVLSWATTSITEIMTMGFGDISKKLPRQRIRFTEEGWESYIKAFEAGRIGDRFKKSQLVLTTVPSNTPVIVTQGVNEFDVYQWVVQMPVIMTYATNNNVAIRERGIVTLMIVRVPSEESSAGIAIQGWSLI